MRPLGIVESESTENTLWRELDHLGDILAIVSAIILATSYSLIFLLGTIFLREAVAPPLLNFLSINLLYLVTRLALGRVIQLRADHQLDIISSTVSKNVLSFIHMNLFDGHPASYFMSYSDVPWASLLSECHTVNMCAQYYSSWIDKQRDDIQALFDRGGTINLFLPNPANKTLVKQIQPLFPETSAAELSKKIANSSEKIGHIFKQTGNASAAFNTYYLDVPVWYAAMMFDEARLTLGVYEASRDRRITSPIMLIKLSEFPKSKDWINEEFKHLLQVAAKTGSGIKKK